MSDGCWSKYYLDIPAGLALRRLQHRRVAGGNGLDMLGAEDQPHPPFARHSPQGALLAGWSLLIACSPLHVVREIDVMAYCCVAVWLVRPPCCRETVWRQRWPRRANSHFLRLRLQFQHPVRVRTCLARGLRRAVWAGRGSRARRLPRRGEAEALSSVIVSPAGLVRRCAVWWGDCSGRRWLREPRSHRVQGRCRSRDVGRVRVCYSGLSTVAMNRRRPRHLAAR